MIIGSENKKEAECQGLGKGQGGRKEWGPVFKKVFILSLTEQALYASTDEKSFAKYKYSFHKLLMNT